MIVLDMFKYNTDLQNELISAKTDFGLNGESHQGKHSLNKIKK